MSQNVSSFNQKRVLVIDPSEHLRLALKLHFERQGAVVFTIGGVEKIRSGVEGILNGHPSLDLILVDVRLPNTYGFFALKRLTEALKGYWVPIFVLSYGHSRLALQHLLRWGCLGYLRKPTTISQVDAFLVERLTHFAQPIAQGLERNRALMALRTDQVRAS